MDETVLDIARAAVFTCLKVGAPVMFVALGIGLVVSFLQAITQIQEPTLTFVPKAVGIMLTITLAMPFMLGTLVAFAQELFMRIGTGA
ncbi:MAG: flagellar type III secretion system protein FliQ [Geminicoccaceae bacterium]|nr:MAG: flagellar type III secretion system protein FliQ [Geminicoccaceae bacterium]